jgi:uncharacterized protein YjiS (DUF1127 family)
MSYPFLADSGVTQAFVAVRPSGDGPVAAWSYRIVELLFGTAAAVAGPVRRAAQAVARYRRNRRAIADLRSLDDRLLRDIGVERSDIPALVRAVESQSTDLDTGRPAHRPERPQAAPNPADGLKLAA